MSVCLIKYFNALSSEAKIYASRLQKSMFSIKGGKNVLHDFFFKGKSDLVNPNSVQRKVTIVALLHGKKFNIFEVFFFFLIKSFIFILNWAVFFH